MTRYIDADAFFFDFPEIRNYEYASQKYEADVVERKHGKWEKKWHSYLEQELPCCSVCGHFSPIRWYFCPNCGADMRKEIVL